MSGFPKCIANKSMYSFLQKDESSGIIKINTPIALIVEEGDDWQNVEVPASEEPDLTSEASAQSQPPSAEQPSSTSEQASGYNSNTLLQFLVVVWKKLWGWFSADNRPSHGASSSKNIADAEKSTLSAEALGSSKANSSIPRIAKLKISDWTFQNPVDHMTNSSTLLGSSVVHNKLGSNIVRY